MLDKNINDYIKIYHNILSDDLCDRSVSSLEKAPWEKNYFYNNITEQREYSTDDLMLLYSGIEESKEIMDCIYQAIENYILRDLNYPWFPSWKGYSNLRFNKYSGNASMHNHCDHIQDLFGPGPNGIPIISVVGSLNDNYEGGEFMMWNEVIEIPKGSVLIFPSNFMYPHRVNSVESGTRYSFVSWVF